MSLSKLSRIAASFALATGLLSSVLAGDYMADTSASSLHWKGTKVGGFHEGSLSLKSGSLKIVDGDLKGGSFEIDLGTINTTDLTGGKKKKLDGHLRSKDFFSVKKFPVADLKITSVSAGDSKGTFDVKANLSIKGISKPVSFKAKLSGSGDSMKATAKVVVDRANYDIKFKSGSFFENLGDKLIHDDFEVDVALVLKKS